MFNARSLRNKFTDLEILSATNEYHIIGVSESWLNTENRDFLAEYNLPGYQMFSCERLNRTGGGVLLYVKASLQPTILEKEKIFNVDTIFLRLKIRSKSMIIGLIYRPPGHNTPSDIKLYDQLTELCNTYDSIFFGDFNLPITSWGNPLNSHCCRELYNNLLESALSQHVHNPTRGNNILDLIFSTNDSLITDVNVGPEFSTSDHKIVSFNINLEVYKTNVSEEQVYMYKQGNYELLRAILSEVDWSVISDTTDIDESWTKFTNILNNAVKSCIPLRKRRPNNDNGKPKWWNKQIELKLSQKKRAYRRYRSTQNECDKIEYERLRREAKKLIREKKKNLELHIASINKTNAK